MNPALRHPSVARALANALGCVSFTCFAVGVAQAQSDAFPSRPITVIVPAAVGATSQQIQALSPCYSSALGQQVIVENRPGAGGAIGAGAVKSARPDGYTLVFAATPVFSVVPHLTTTTYTLDDFVAIGNLTATPMLMVARMNAPYKSFQEFLAYSKGRPTEVNFASGGVGTSMHLTGEALQVVAGLDFTHVPFQGGVPAVQGLLSNSADVVIGPPALFKAMIDADRLRPLALFGETRFRGLPNVPTARELGTDLVELLKSGLLAPRGTPKPVLDKLVKGFADAMNDRKCTDTMTKANMDLYYMGPDAFEKDLKAEVARYDKLFANTRFAARVRVQK